MAKKKVERKVRTFRVKTTEELKLYSEVLASMEIIYTVKAIKSGFEFKTIDTLSDDERLLIVEKCK